jgi:hypothetical protein
LSWKDQQQYWSGPNESYIYISPDELSSMFKENHIGRKVEEPCIPQKSKFGKEALALNKYSLQKLEMFKACGAREALLMKRSMFIYVFKTGQVIFHCEALFLVQSKSYVHSEFYPLVQLAVVAVMTMFMFYRTRMATDLTHANYYMGALYYSLFMIMLNGIPEMSMQIARLPSFNKQKSYNFYPSWAYAIPSWILKIPITILEVSLWVFLTYYVIGFDPNVGR